MNTTILEWGDITIRVNDTSNRDIVNSLSLAQFMIREHITGKTCLHGDIKVKEKREE